MIYEPNYSLLIEFQIDERCAVNILFKDQQMSVEVVENKWDDESKRGIAEHLQITQIRSLADALTDFANKVDEYKKQHP